MSAKNFFLALYPQLKRPISQKLYNYVSTLDKDAAMLLLNYGYADLDPNAEQLQLPAEDERHRYPIQLYHHVAHVLNWDGLKVLEVGSGRGGGAAYIMRQFNPELFIGVDISEKSVDFSNRHYSIEGLSFSQGDAESLQFDDDSFDVVVNVESSQYYPNVANFFKEVVRVLRIDGYFLYTDFRLWEETVSWRAHLMEIGMKLIMEENITPNVVRALELDSERRGNLVHQYAPRALHKPFCLFAGLESKWVTCDVPKAGELIYWNFIYKNTGTQTTTSSASVAF